MRSFVKSIILAIFYVVVLPSGLAARLFYNLTGREVLFNLFSQIYALGPGIPGRYLRVCYYHQTLDESSLTANFSFGSVMTKIQARVGGRVYVGLYSSIGFAEIGEGAVVANYVSILSGRRQHNFEDPERAIFVEKDVFSKVTIGANSFVGEKATVMADVGRCSILGAGAVVVADIPDYVVAVGNPAKVIRERKPARGAR